MCQELMLFNPMTGETHELWQENKDNQDLYNACAIAINALCAENEWISVKEKSPNESGMYLTSIKGYVNVSWYWIGRDKWESGSGLYINATHWMPLPQPPKGDGK